MSVTVEARSVETWRYDTLRQAGYDPATALLLAVNPDVDLHEAVDLIEGGCPSLVAADILR